MNAVSPNPPPHVFTTLTAVAAPLLRANVDTDAIIASREIKTVSRRGLAAGLFAGWRYGHSADPGSRTPDPQFVLNRPEYAGARILLAGANFGCGSSREHAVWALHEYGIGAIDADSRAALLCGLDAIDVTLESRAAIESYAARDRHRRPWVYLEPAS